MQNTSYQTPVKHSTEPVQVQVWPISTIRPAPENDDIYRAISVHDVADLMRSIREHGIQEPLLVSSDGFIISGNRRWTAAIFLKVAAVPVRVHLISRTKNPAEFLKLLVECNSQRIKGADVLLAESVIKVDPVAAHETIVSEREAKEARRSNDCTLSVIATHGNKRRCDFSPAKKPLLDAILRIVEEQREFWPLSVRQIHYRLLGENAPLIHASKRDSHYRNDRDSYRAAVDVAARARIRGLVLWQAIADETRPVDSNKAFHDLGEFFRQETANFLTGYWRDLLQSQPHHVEIVAEKLTVRSILARVAREHTMPMTISRGMCSLPAKRKIYERYACSQKEKLILLCVSDLDPAGDTIAADLPESFEQDFGLDDVEAFKAALTIEQVEQYGLAPSMEANTSSPTYPTFVERYGVTDAFELEAMEPANLAMELILAIEEVIDVDLFNQELGAEQADAVKVVAIQRQCAAFFKSLKCCEPPSQR